MTPAQAIMIGSFVLRTSMGSFAMCFLFFSAVYPQLASKLLPHTILLGAGAVAILLSGERTNHGRNGSTPNPAWNIGNAGNLLWFLCTNLRQLAKSTPLKLLAVLGLSVTLVLASIL